MLLLCVYDPLSINYVHIQHTGVLIHFICAFRCIWFINPCSNTTYWCFDSFYLCLCIYM